MKASETEIAVLVTLGLVLWFAWAWMQTRGGQDEQASQEAEVDHARTQAQGAARGDAPETVHRVWRGDHQGHTLARGARGRGDASGVHPDVREHWASTPTMQPAIGRTHGRGRDEQPSTTGERPTQLVSE